MEVKSTTNVVLKNDRQLIGTAKEITARNSSNQNVTTLSGSITIELTVTKAELVAAALTFAQVQAIKITYFDSTAGSWVEIPTVVTLSVPSATTVAGLNDDPAVTLTGTTTHLSTYAPSIPTDSDAPPVPTGLVASVENGYSTLSWTASTGATKYDVYKKIGDDYPYLAQTTSTAYAATGLTNGTTYYFKVSALDASNKESAATSAVSVTPSTPPPSGGNPYVAPATVPATPATPATPAVPAVPATPATSTTPATSAKPASASSAYNLGATTLKSGSEGKPVKELQRFLNDKLNLGLKLDGKLGPKTIAVIKKWQKANGLKADGLVGVKTKAKMNAMVK